MPCLSHAARSHMADRASSAPASQLDFLLALLLFEYMPTQKTAGTHTISHDIVVMRSECCAGVCTCPTAARTLKSSGATTLSASMETAGCIGAGGQRSSEGIELSGVCRVCRRLRESHDLVRIRVRPARKGRTDLQGRVTPCSAPGMTM